MFCLYACLTLHAYSAYRRQGSDLLELEVWMVVSHYNVLEIGPGLLEKQLVLLTDALAQESGVRLYTHEPKHSEGQGGRVMTSRPFWAIKQNSVLENLKKAVEMKVPLPIQRAPSSACGDVLWAGTAALLAPWVWSLLPPPACFS